MVPVDYRNKHLQTTNILHKLFIMFMLFLSILQIMLLTVRLNDHIVAFSTGEARSNC